MSDEKVGKEMVIRKSRYKAVSCSTPEPTMDSPSRDSDSEAASPVPFLCTQDGSEGDTDVVWNFNNTNSNYTKRPKNTTPLSRKAKKHIRPKLPEKSLPKRKVTRLQKSSQLFQELIELNQNINKFIEKKPKLSEADKPPSGSEEDVFNDGIDCSPRSVLRSSSRCLRKNVLSSKFAKPESDNGLESDDSMNECLLKASQVVEENIMNIDIPAKRPCFEPGRTGIISFDLTTNEDSMDAILKTVTSPVITKVKVDSPGLTNDSFDCLVGNLDDSALDRLTQMPVKHESSRKNRGTNAKDNDWLVRELVVHDGSPPKLSFARHSSMPESPSVNNYCRPSISGVSLGRYNSMPFNNSDGKVIEPGVSPIKCTPTEIQKKRQQAREKLLAKRLLPFTQTQQTGQLLPTEPSKQTSGGGKKLKFQPKVPCSKITNNKSETTTNSNQSAVTPMTVMKTNQNSSKPSNPVDIKSLIERNRQEALMKLRRRQPINK